jgi:hypothetical protein
MMSSAILYDVILSSSATTPNDTDDHSDITLRSEVYDNPPADVLYQAIANSISDCQNISPFGAERPIYGSYRTANLQTLHFKYLFNKYPY